MSPPLLSNDMFFVESFESIEGMDLSPIEEFDESLLYTNSTLYVINRFGEGVKYHCYKILSPELAEVAGVSEYIQPDGFTGFVLRTVSRIDALPLDIKGCVVQFVDDEIRVFNMRTVFTLLKKDVYPLLAIPERSLSSGA